MALKSLSLYNNFTLPLINSFYKVTLKEGHLGYFSLVKYSKVMENTCPWYNFLTLFLTEESVSHHSHLVPKIYMLSSLQVLCENVGNLLTCGNVLKLHCSFLGIVPNKVEPGLNML